MNRAEMRRAEREKTKRTPVYQFTEEQLNAKIQEAFEEHTDQLMRQAIDKAFIYMIGIPLDVLFAQYWTKTAKKKAPEFVEKILDVYECVQNGILTEQEIIDEVYELSGVRIDQDILKSK